MSAKLPGEPATATITGDDQRRIDAVLKFWFREEALSAPQIDRRMDVWFGDNPAFDRDLEKRFGDDVERASAGRLDHWAGTPRGRLALILLLDQFRRNVYRGTADAFAKDDAALKLCLEGAMAGLDRGLSAIERVFFYMPLQHAESRKIQAKAVELYNKLAEAVSPTYRETFSTIAQFAELHRDIIEQFGRFPHRNRVLGRANTPEEEEFLADEDTPDFGQST